MKNLVAIVSVCLMVSGSIQSCHPANDPSAHCPNAGAHVKRVSQSRGTVYYDSTQTSWYIQVPNSFDSHDIGYACNLASDYQKAGLQVVFSGSYYAYDKTIYRFAGDKFFYLSLESVSL